MLKTDQTLNFYVSVLLSIIGFLVCLTIPFAALENPCDIFAENQLIILHIIMKWIEKHLVLFDFMIISLTFVLIVVSTTTVIDAIQNTNISMSPWVERGRYKLPSHTMQPHSHRRTYKSENVYEYRNY